MYIPSAVFVVTSALHVIAAEQSTWVELVGKRGRGQLEVGLDPEVSTESAHTHTRTYLKKNYTRVELVGKRGRRQLEVGLNPEVLNLHTRTRTK
jgi:hypothetical protein